MNRLRYRPIVVALLLMLLIPCALAEVLTVVPVKDNTLYEDPAGLTSNGAGPGLFVGRTDGKGGGLLRRALIAFDVSAIPPGSTINSVEVTLTVDKTSDGTARSLGLHRVLQGWGEGLSDAGDPGGQGTTAIVGDATWIHTSFPAQSWVNPGGDFASSPGSTVQVGGVGSYTWDSTTKLVKDVEVWVDNPLANFGWLVQGDETSLTTTRRLASREHPTESDRPVLTVDYTPPSIQFVSASFAVTEGEGAATIRVSRSGRGKGTATVDYSTSDGTATAGVDYESVSGTLTFLNGQAGEKSFKVVILADDSYQGERTVQLDLSDPTGVTLGDPATAVLTISDEEDLDNKLHFSQFGNGEGFFSQVILQSLSDSKPVFARILVKTKDGQPFPVSLNGQPLVEGQLDQLIPAAGLASLQTDATGPVLSGSVVVCSDQPLAGVIVFGGEFGLAGVGSVRSPGKEFIGPVEVEKSAGTDTGLAVQNLDDEIVTVQLELLDSGGTVLAASQIDLPALGQEALFVTQLEWDQTVDFTLFRGTVRASANGRVTAVMIQTRTGQFATLPTVITAEGIFGAVKDNTLIEDDDGRFSNGSGEAFFAGRTGPNEGLLRRGLVAFDVSSIPPGSMIEGVSLTLTVARSPQAINTIERTFTLHRLQKDWGEGASKADSGVPGSGDGGGTAAMAGDSTWVHTFFDSSSWSQPGGDFEADSSAALTIGDPGTYTWQVTADLISDVQGWVDDPANNFGWVILGDESTVRTARRFASRENPSIESRPRLTVYYTPGDSEQLYFAQFGNGHDFFSQIALLNRELASEADVSIFIKDDDGQPFEAELNGQPLVNGQLDVVIPPAGLEVLKSDAMGTPQAGSVVVTSDQPLAGVIVFGGGFGLAGVGSSAAATAFTGPVENNSNLQVKTGLAVQNLEKVTTTVSLQLLDSEGQLVASAQIELVPEGHTALFTDQIEWDSTVDFTSFKGSIRATSDGRTSASMIQTRPGQFATLPVTAQ